MAGQAFGYGAAASVLGQTAKAIFPATGWVGKVAAIAQVLGSGADAGLAKHRRRMWGEYDPKVLYRQMGELYEREAKAVAQPAPVSRPSRYLMEEGAARVDEDCFACATSHMAGMEGALLRAERQIRQAGTCGDECVRWLMLAAQEPSALFARDWTAEHYERNPQPQRDVIDRYTPRLRAVQRKLLGGDRLAEQREAVLEAAALLKESTRFTEAGDGLGHPEVEWRRMRAEADLTAAERVRVGVLPKETATELRRLRQQVGSGISSADDVKTAAQKADEVSRAVAGPALQKLTVEDIAALRAEMASMRADFAADRRRVGAAQAGDPKVACLGDIGHFPASGGKHLPPRGWVEDVTLPGEGLAQASSSEDVATMFERVGGAVEARGTEVWLRNLPSTFEQTLFGLYDTEDDTMLLDDAALVAHYDPFWFQVLAHESTHSLLDGPRCYGSGYAPGIPYDQQPSELRAQAASLAAMVDLGLPVYLADGSKVPAGSRRVDWTKLRDQLGEQGVEDVRWATGWMTDAAKGQFAGLDAAVCPARRGPAG